MGWDRRGSRRGGGGGQEEIEGWWDWAEKRRGYRFVKTR